MRRQIFTGAALAAAGAGALAAYVLAVRPWHLRWGATDEEVSRPMPGDELVAHPNVLSTHAITINAPVEEVWPWLVQIGQDKGGFYSYSWLENLVWLLALVVFEPAHFIMERKMMLGLKERAEAETNGNE